MAQALSEAALLALVDRLADGGWHSGEQLASECGISRAALAKRIEKLKDWQLLIEARQGLGYRLGAPIERLDQAALQSQIDVPLRVLAVTDSTNSQLMNSASARDPQILLAEYQTAGRGRRGREWLSPFAAQLAFSIAWSFDAMPPQLSALPLAVGTVCARVLHQYNVVSAQIKWPNDLIAHQRKLAGILLEHRGEGGGGCRVVIGVGLNLALQAVQLQSVTQPWINLGEALSARAPMPSRNDLAADLLRALVALLRDYPRHGFSQCVADYARFDATNNQAVRVIMGERVIDGIARGIDDDGALLVDAAGTRHTLHAGEVSLRLSP